MLTCSNSININEVYTQIWLKEFFINRKVENWLDRRSLLKIILQSITTVWVRVNLYRVYKPVQEVWYFLESNHMAHKIHPQEQIWECLPDLSPKKDWIINLNQSKTQALVFYLQRFQQRNITQLVRTSAKFLPRNIKERRTRTSLGSLIWVKVIPKPITIRF